MLNIFHKIKEYFAPKKELTIDEIRSVVRDEIKNMRGIQILDKSPTRCELSPTLNTRARSESQEAKEIELIEQIHEVLLSGAKTATGIARAMKKPNNYAQRALKPILEKWQGVRWIAYKDKDATGRMCDYYELPPQKNRARIKPTFTPYITPHPYVRRNPLTSNPQILKGAFMKALFTTKEVAKILNISKVTLDKYAMASSDKNHRFYLEFSGGNGGRRLYARSVIKAKLIEFGASEQDAEQTLSAFDMENTK